MTESDWRNLLLLGFFWLGYFILHSALASLRAKNRFAARYPQGMPAIGWVSTHLRCSRCCRCPGCSTVRRYGPGAASAPGCANGLALIAPARSCRFAQALRRAGVRRRLAPVEGRHAAGRGSRALSALALASLRSPSLVFPEPGADLDARHERLHAFVKRDDDPLFHRRLAARGRESCGSLTATAIGATWSACLVSSRCRGNRSARWRPPNWSRRRRRPRRAPEPDDKAAAAHSARASAPCSDSLRAEPAVDRGQQTPVAGLEGDLRAVRQRLVRNADPSGAGLQFFQARHVGAMQGGRIAIVAAPEGFGFVPEMLLDHRHLVLRRRVLDQYALLAAGFRHAKDMRSPARSNGMMPGPMWCTCSCCVCAKVGAQTKTRKIATNQPRPAPRVEKAFIACLLDVQVNADQASHRHSGENRIQPAQAPDTGFRRL